MPYSIKNVISQATLAEFCKVNDIKKLSLFGSALQDQLRPDSDIDVLVEFEKNHVPGFLNLVKIEMELSARLGRKVDLRTPEELSSYFRDEVIQHAELQYQA